MAFEKGNKLGTGRPKGAVNITSHEKRQLIDHIKMEGADKFIEEMMTLKGIEYCKIFIDAYNNFTLYFSAIFCNCSSLTPCVFCLP